jgi:CHAD domain-containing protein
MEGATPRAVHALRVAIRRVLAGLDLLAAVRPECPPVRKRLRHQLKMLGGIRDIHIERRLILCHREFAHALRPLAWHLAKRERHRAKALPKRLAQGKALARLKRWAVSSADGTTHAVLRVKKVLERKMQDAFDPLVSILPAKAVEETTRHRFRQKARDFCYTLELLPASWRDTYMRRLLESLHAYRDLVGAMHDCSTVLRRVERAAVKGDVSLAETAAFVGWLETRIGELEDSCDGMERRIFHQAMLARREIRHTQPVGDVAVRRTERGKATPPSSRRKGGEFTVSVEKRSRSRGSGGEQEGSN